MVPAQYGMDQFKASIKDRNIVSIETKIDHEGGMLTTRRTGGHLTKTATATPIIAARE